MLQTRQWSQVSNSSWGLFLGPSASGQGLEKEVDYLDFPGSSWLTLSAPASAEAERKIRKHLASSSEPILDLKTEAAAVLPVATASLNTTETIPLIDLECAPIANVEVPPIFNVPLATQDPAQIPKPPWDFSVAGFCDPELPLPPPPERIPPSEAGSFGSLPWPEAPDECVPLRPNTLDLLKPLRKLEELKQMGERRNSDNINVKENGLENCPNMPHVSEERRALQSELGKCIEDFRKIKIPASFPNKKRPWQNELLKKYKL
ncbi:uncharacterized protein LOC143822401 [Paroedura picta]|uniref:uncharacterized protein LOC143822401 n=1 Tax=Paroedura picta TaxID=143630 RepID=UPI004056891B